MMTREEREARWADIERRYQAGELVRDIAAGYGVSGSRIYQILIDRNVPRLPGRGGRPRRPRTTDGTAPSEGTAS